MWLSVILSCILLQKKSSAEFGLPISIPNLRSTIETVIGDGVQPVNKILQEIKFLNTENTFQFTNLLQDAMVNTSQIQDGIFKSLTEAVNDKKTGHRKVFDKLYGNINRSKEQIPVTRSIMPDYYPQLIGNDRYRSMDDTWNALENGLIVLNKSITALDHSITTGQLSRSISSSDVANYVTSKQITALKDSLQSIMTSVTKLHEIASSLLNLFKMTTKDKESTYLLLDKMLNFDKIIQSVDNATSLNQNSVRALTQNLNRTVQINYQPLTKIKLIDNRGNIDKFLQQFGLMITVLDETGSLFKYIFNMNVPYKLTSLVSYIHNIVQYSLDDAFMQLLKNSSLSDVCHRRYPLVGDPISKVVKLTESCVQQQLEYLLRIVQMIEEFIQPIRAMLFSPLEDLKACTSRLNGKLCYPSFANMYLGEPENSDPSLLSSVGQLLQRMNMVTSNEIGSAYQRIDTCTTSELAMPSVMDLWASRMDCYKGA